MAKKMKIEKNPYKLLQVAPNATLEEVRAAYIRRVKDYDENDPHIEALWKAQEKLTRRLTDKGNWFGDLVLGTHPPTRKERWADAMRKNVTVRETSVSDRTLLEQDFTQAFRDLAGDKKQFNLAPEIAKNIKIVCSPGHVGSDGNQVIKAYVELMFPQGAEDMANKAANLLLIGDEYRHGLGGEIPKLTPGNPYTGQPHRIVLHAADGSLPAVARATNRLLNAMGGKIIGHPLAMRPIDIGAPSPQAGR